MSYWNVGDKTQLGQSDIEITCEGNNSFQEDQVIGIFIPPSVKFFSGKDCRLRFDLDIVELGRGENHSINELAEMFEWGYTYIPERPGEAKVTLCDTSIAKKDIGYEPKVNLKDYIKEVISE